MSFRLWNIAGSVVLTSLIVLVACGTERSANSAEPTDPESEGSGLPEGFNFTVGTSAAQLGDELVVAEEPSGGSTRTVLRNSDGRYASLPSAPALVGHTMVSSGAGVVLVGISCDSEECFEAHLAAFLLRSDRSAWDEIETPDATVFDSTTVEHVGGGTANPTLMANNQLFRVVADRVERLDAPEPMGLEFMMSCATADGSAVYSVTTQRLGTVAPPNGVPDGVQRGPLAYNAPVVNIATAETDFQEFTDVPTAPMPSTVADLSVLCGDRHLIVTADREELVFDGEQWTQSPPQPALQELGRQRLVQHRAEVLSDGSLAVVPVEGGSVWIRSADGVWSRSMSDGAQAVVGEALDGQPLVTDELHNALTPLDEP